MGNKMKRQYMILVCTCIAILMFLAIVPFSTSLMYTASHIPDNIKRNIPLDFTGQILDQNNKPIEGVDVLFDYEATSWTGNVRRYPIQSRSDKDGLFKIRGYRGIQIGYRKMEKDGYYFRKWQDDGHVYVYSPSNGPKYVPDSVKPEIFRGWCKSGSQERLLQIKGYTGKVPDNGSVVSVYISKGTIRWVQSQKNDADIWITLKTTPAASESDRTWSCTFECPSGGLRKVVDDYGYLAPEEDYQQVLTFNYNRPKENKVDHSEKFYVHLQAKKIFAVINVEIYPNFHRRDYQEDAIFGISGYVNPNGSRNLEPGKDILNP